ncbi:iron ABC transporter substrate-binding protein [Selenomonas sp. oral taxon 920]|uniref:ABC transporter substrate-binding protein n=1 Tax=Selenomonas sp. oral taxon 920 TaxID=1884263 RepID=UPI000840B1AB|nr:ABC transporter substrate-binding protein [Selenomonas sp. oral taxon 920]AOH47060.1 iron ABC transporter substrate-binding protein [Selenomonas sp. oral taxon 920]
MKGTQTKGRMLRRISHMLSLLPLLALSALILLLSATDGRGSHAPSEQPVDGITYTTADSEGRPATFTLAHPPERVLISYPGATELLIDLSLESRIIGTIAPYGAEPPSYADAYTALPILAAPYVPSREEVVALRPDLIIGWSHHFTPEALGDVYSYFDRSVGAYIVPATVRKGRPTLEETVYPFIADMGHLFGTEERAAEYTRGLQERVAAVEKRSTARKRRYSAMILQSHGSSLYSMYGPAYIIDDIARKAGADNIIDRQMRSVGPERVLGFAPEVIIYVNAKDRTEEEARAELRGDPNLQNMKAVRENRIIIVNFSDVNNGNGRCITALEDISAGLDALRDE